MTTGERLKNLRKENNFTLEQLEKMLGITYQAYIKYEKDKCFPSVRNLIRISQLYNVSTDYILCLSEKRK